MAKEQQKDVLVKVDEEFTYTMDASRKRTLPAGWQGYIPAAAAKALKAEGKGSAATAQKAAAKPKAPEGGGAQTTAEKPKAQDGGQASQTADGQAQQDTVQGGADTSGEAETGAGDAPGGEG